MENEIAVLGQLGMANKVANEELPNTDTQQPHYTISNQNESTPAGLLPRTGEWQDLGGFLLPLIFLLILVVFALKFEADALD